MISYPHALMNSCSRALQPSCPLAIVPPSSRTGKNQVTRGYFVISSLRAFRRARDSAAKCREDWKRSRWPDAKFEVAGAKRAVRNDRSPAQSFARSLTHSLAKRKREERGSRPRKTTTTRRREKREERREKSEERREREGKRQERRQNTYPKRPPEVPK